MIEERRALASGTLLSIVVPIYNEEEVFGLLVERMTRVIDALPVRCEVVLVNDGSRDRSLDLMRAQVEADPRYRAVDLARNFGHQIAVSAGLSVVMGDVVAIIDADLQDPPELLADMLKRWEAGADVVYGKRRRREGESSFKRGTASLFYRFLDSMSDVNIPRDAGDFRMVDRRVADLIARMPERHRFLRGMFAWVGFKQEEFAYDRPARAAGETKYPFWKMLALAVDAILSFSVKPLRLMTWLGLVVTSLSFMAGLYLLFLRIAHPEAFPPAAAGMFVALLFMFGVNFLFLGIIGEYLGRVFVNVQGRPPFIIRRVYERGEDAASAARAVRETGLRADGPR